MSDFIKKMTEETLDGENLLRFSQKELVQNITLSADGHFFRLNTFKGVVDFPANYSLFRDLKTALTEGKSYFFIINVKKNIDDFFWLLKKLYPDFEVFCFFIQEGKGKVGFFDEMENQVFNDLQDEIYPTAFSVQSDFVKKAA